MRKRRWKRAPFGSLIRHAVVADSPAGGSGGSEAPFSCSNSFPQCEQAGLKKKPLRCAAAAKWGRPGCESMTLRWPWQLPQSSTA